VEQRKWRTLFLIALGVFVLMYVLGGESFRAGPVKFFAVILVLFGYLAGLLATVIHSVLLLVGLILSLPVISVVYAAILAFFAKLHYIIFKTLFKSGIKKTPWYNRGEAWIKKSRTYQALSRHLHRLLKNLGISKPKTVHMFEMDQCPKCEKEIPIVGRFCPYCGGSLEE
jgi:hypothetical protein